MTTVNRKKTFLYAAITMGISMAIYAGGRSETRGEEGEITSSDHPSYTQSSNDIRYYNTPSEYQVLTGKKLPSYNEAPMLTKRVRTDRLPPVEERVSEEPMVVLPYEEIGQYGGYARAGTLSKNHYSGGNLLLGIEQLNRIAGDLVTQSPNVATSWMLSSDAKTVTVHLRRGIRWNDGEPFTTADVKFWFEDILGNPLLTPDIPAQWRPGGKLMEMNFVDDYTFQFIFAVSQPSFPELLAHPNRGVTPIKHAMHYFRQFHAGYVDTGKLTVMAKTAGFESWISLFNHKNRSWSDLPLGNAERPCITIYDLIEYGTDLFVWERNPYYWKVDVDGNQLPYMDGLQIEYLPDVKDFADKTIAGDFTITTGWVTPLSDYTLLKDHEESGDYRVVLWPTMEGSSTIFQLNRTSLDPHLGPLFADKRFSQALSLALDREEMNDVLFHGLGVPRQMTLIRESIYFKPEFAEAYTYFDLETANSILDDLGLQWDSRREKRLLPNGQKLSILMEGGGESPIAKLAAEHWKRIGIGITFRGFSQEESEWRAKTNQMQMFMTQGFNCRSEAFAASPLFFVPQRQGWENPWGNQWALWYETGGKEGFEPPREVKKNLERWEQMVSTMDREEKIRLGQEILASQAENLWTIGTVGEVPAYPMTVSNNLRNFPPRGAHDWSIGAWTTPQHPAQFFLIRD